MLSDLEKTNPELFNQQIRIDAPAKVNLRLKIEGVRSDGYHLLSMLNVPIDLSDRLFVTLTSSPGVTLRVGADFMGELIDPALRTEIAARLSDPAQNLAARAAQLFISTFQIPFGIVIELHKDIPLGAGLGGGSSDAGRLLGWLTNTLKGSITAQHGITLEEFWEKVIGLAAGLGADIPFFLDGRFAYVSGIGEKVQSLDPRIIMNLAGLIILPALEISTSDIFGQVRKAGVAGTPDTAGADFVRRYREFIALLDPGSESSFLPGSQYTTFREELKGLIANDLEEAVFTQVPSMRKLVESLRAIPDCIVSVSGSGGAVTVLGKSKNYISLDLSQAVARQVQNLAVTIRPTIFNPIA